MADSPDMPAFKCDEITGWSLTEIAAWRPAQLESALAAAGTADLPKTVGGVARRGPLTSIRIAPDRLWLIDDGPTPRDFGVVLAGLCAASLRGRARFRLRGAACGQVLGACVAIDWEKPDVPMAYAAQTMLHRIPIMIHRRGEDEFDLFVQRGFAISLSESIADAAQEFVAK